jgi:hypothetical protein
MDWNDLVNAKYMDQRSKSEEDLNNGNANPNKELTFSPFYYEISRAIFDGSKKRSLTQWWLELIETEVDNYLNKIGCDLSAVPFHYIDHPPK